jgi:hypothetical protein
MGSPLRFPAACAAFATAADGTDPSMSACPSGRSGQPRTRSTEGTPPPPPDRPGRARTRPGWRPVRPRSARQTSREPYCRCHMSENAPSLREDAQHSSRGSTIAPSDFHGYPRPPSGGAVSPYTSPLICPLPRQRPEPMPRPPEPVRRTRRAPVATRTYVRVRPEPELAPRSPHAPPERRGAEPGRVSVPEAGSQRRRRTTPGPRVGAWPVHQPSSRSTGRGSRPCAHCCPSASRRRLRLAP